MDAPTPDQLLEIAVRDYRHGGSREEAIRTELDLSAIQFWASVNRLIDDPPADVALRWGPEINRLLRRRQAGMRQKAARTA